MIALPRVIGHRGAAALAPENTLASVRRAAQAGARMVEFDVRLTADGEPVVFHDDRLERTSDGSGPVAVLTLAELRALDAGAWFDPAFAGERIPTLDEVLALCGELGLAVNMEIKPERGREALTARVALERAMALWPAGIAPPLVSSFSRPALAEAARVAPGWPRGLLVGRVPGDWRRLAGEFGCASINVEHRRLTPARVAAFHRDGLAVLAYTVNRPGRAVELWRMGVDAIFSDHPAPLIAAETTQIRS